MTMKYRCQRCGKIYDHKNNFRKHVTRKKPCKVIDHSLIKDVQINSVNTQRFDCPNCNKSFTRKDNLKRHKLNYCKEKQVVVIEDCIVAAKHEDVNHKKFICNYCKKNFSRNFTLKRHLSICKIKICFEIGKEKVRNELKQEIRNELKQEIRNELKQEIRNELKQEIIEQQKEMGKLQDEINRLQLQELDINIQNTSNIKCTENLEKFLLEDDNKNECNLKNYEIIKFNNSSITMIKNNIILFKTIDILKILEYKDYNKAIETYIDNDNKMELDTKESSNDIFINEFGLHSLILNSKSKKVKQFEQWIIKKVIPSVRKYGSYNNRVDYKHKSYYDNGMITLFEGKNVVYIGYIGMFYNEHIFKFGKTRDIYNRDIKKHRKNFNFFDIIHIKECTNHEIIEEKFKKELIAKNIYRRIKINGKKKTELFTITNKISIENVIQLLENVIKYFPINKEIEIAEKEFCLYKEKNRNLELQIEYEKIKNQSLSF